MAQLKDIYFSTYELQPRAPLNAVVAMAPRVGALLRVDDGFADCHPWAELGDLPLAQQFEALKAGQPTLLMQRSLNFAKIDAAARKAGQNLFANLEVPLSHAICVDFFAQTERASERLRTWAAQGFRRVKIKMPRDLHGVGVQLATAAAQADTVLKFRLDFNECQSPLDLEKFLSALPSEFLDAIDFLEDPMPYRSDTQADWARLTEKFQVRFALDRELTPARVAQDTFDVCVIKAAHWDPLPIAASAADHLKRVLVTSYMDHPLGQVTAAYAAAQVAARHPLLVEDAGLLTHELFEKNEFSEALGSGNPQLKVPSGAGWGWGEVLEKRSWEKLI